MLLPISVNLTVEIRISIEKDKSEPISNGEKVRIIFAWCAWQDLNLHPRGPEPKSGVSANSTTGAFYKNQVAKPDIYLLFNCYTEVALPKSSVSVKHVYNYIILMW